MRFKGQTVVVTGAGNGIGREIALAFGREGAQVVLAGRSGGRLTEVASELRALGAEPLAVATDVTVERQVRDMVAAALGQFGEVDALVNNAGIAGPTKLARDVTAEEWAETLATNLSGAFYCARQVAGPMMARKRGAIVNISSVAGRIGYPLRTPYAASKWGLIGLSHSLAAELGPYGIRVNAVLPGVVAGERIDQAIAAHAAAEDEAVDNVRARFVKDIPLGRMPTEAEVAETVLFLASDAASGMTGQAVTVCGGFRMQ